MLVRSTDLRRMAPLAPLALAVLLSPGAHAQRGADGPRVRALGAPQENLVAPSADRFAARRLRKAGGARPVIALAGYWPPSNEAIRRFSQSATQNPAGWIGADWEGRGYDVVSFFPEFTPPNCNNCGQGSGDLEVDYQDTSMDFWPLMDSVDPVAVVTFSRGFLDDSWELEMNQYNRTSWIDDFTAPLMPTPNPPDAGWPANGLRLSTLPVQKLVDDVNAAAVGAAAFICFSGDGGGFLSEYLAYHGTWYQALHADPNDPDWCIAGGHVHVGGTLSWTQAQEAAKVTLRGLIDYLDSVLLSPCLEPVTYCTPKLSSAGCLPAMESVGYPSLQGGSFQVRATGLHNQVPGIAIWSFGSAAIPFQGGTLCLSPPVMRTPSKSTGGPGGATTCTGTLGFVFDPAYIQTQGFSSGQNLFAQVWTRDLGDAFGSSLSDAIGFVWCP